MNVTELEALLRALSPAIKLAIEKALSGQSAARDEALQALETRVKDTVAGVALIPGPPGPVGAQGIGGPPGDGIELATIEAMIQTALAAAIEKMPKPQDGKDGDRGPPGEDGEDAPSMDDLRSVIADEVGRQLAALIEKRDTMAEFTKALGDAFDREAASYGRA